MAADDAGGPQPASHDFQGGYRKTDICRGHGLERKRMEVPLCKKRQIWIWEAFVTEEDTSLRV
jgi:hypothetical protein